MRRSTSPVIEWEEIGPKRAEAYLAKNVSNRIVRKGTVAAYARDMTLGNWLPTHQGIAFNDRGELIDGQHRLQAIVESGVTVRMLVTHGIPAEVGEMRTMDAVDRGAVRSVADQLQLQHGYRNSAQVAGCGSAITQLTLRKWIGRITVPQMLKILEIYGRHIDPIIQAVNASHVSVFRRAYVTAPLAFARAVAPQRIDDFTASLATGVNLTAESPVLLLRNHLLALAGVTTNQGRQLSHLALNCAEAFVLNTSISRLSFRSSGLNYFAERQKDNLAKIADVFQTTVSLAEAVESPKTAEKPPPPRVLTAADIKLTPAAEALLRSKDNSDRLNGRVAKMQARIARGDLAGAAE